MPSAIFSSPPRNGITKFTNCRLLRGNALVWDDIWVSSRTGKVIRSQTAFYDEQVMPDATVDLGGRIVSPGMIECQLNGCFGFNFSTVLDDMTQYGKAVRDLNRQLVQTGVTSYVPTVTSQTSELYHKVLPYLAPTGQRRDPDEGAEGLGAHCEGPFLSPTKNGVHNVEVLREAHSIADVEAMYGAANVNPAVLRAQEEEEEEVANGEGGEATAARPRPRRPLPVRMITAAPERGAMTALIPELAARGITYSIGHSEATYEQASAAVGAGATMITHLFNAMRPLHHRNPGVFGVLGIAESRPRPYFGIISDGIHLHPTTVRIAWAAHPDGLILVTDAMHTAGLPDGVYRWTNGDGEHYLTKKGPLLLLEGSETIAGSSITLIECVNNFLRFTGATVPQALKAVTATPAAMLGLQGVKGTLDAGADADLIIFSEAQAESAGDTTQLVVDEVWKFGVKVFERGI